MSLNEYALRVALLDPAPYPALRRVAQSMLASVGRDARRDLRCFEVNADQAAEASEDVVINVMDCLVGWCGDKDKL